MTEIDERDRLNKLLDLYQHPGWAILLEELTGALEIMERIDSVSNEASLEYRKGQVERMRLIRAMPEIHRNQMLDLDRRPDLFQEEEAGLEDPA